MSTADPPHILAVDDKNDTRILLKHQLSGPYEVTVAPDEEMALQAVESGSFDLLLLDINLQAESGGIDLLHAIREREDLPSPPAIALTAYAMTGDREWLLSEGFEEYVSKPFMRENLISKIEETL